MATHSSTLAWRIPWTEEPGGLQSMGSQRVRQAWATSLWLFSCCSEQGLLSTAVPMLRLAGVSLAVEHRLWGVQASITTSCMGCKATGSVVVAHGLSCSSACGIFPDQGSNPYPLHWQVNSHPLRHQGSSLLVFFLFVCLFVFYFEWISFCKFF